MSTLIGTLKQGTPPTQAELEAEAKAWGFNTWAEFCEAQDEAARADPDSAMYDHDWPNKLPNGACPPMNTYD